MSFKDSPRFMDRVDEIIVKNLSDKNFGVSDLSQQLAISKSQTYRKIKQHTNISTALYIRKIRLEKAHQLIIKTDLILSEIAYTVGFANLAYFSKCFSSQFGYVPSQLRRDLED